MTLRVEGSISPDRAISSLVVGEQIFHAVHRSTSEAVELYLADLSQGRTGKQAVLEDMDGSKVTTDAERLRRRGRIGGYLVTAVRTPLWLPTVKDKQYHPAVENPKNTGERISIMSVDPAELVTGRSYVLRFRGRSAGTTFDTEAMLEDQSRTSLTFDIDDMVKHTMRKSNVMRDPNNLGVTIYPQQVENPDALVFVQSGKLVSSLR